MKKNKKQFTASDAKHTVGFTADQLKQINGGGNLKYEDIKV